MRAADLTGYEPGLIFTGCEWSQDDQDACSRCSGAHCCLCSAAGSYGDPCQHDSLARHLQHPGWLPRTGGGLMPCTHVPLPGGIRAIVCHRTRTPRCACGAEATLQCDAPAQRKSGTCDRHICAACATEVGPDRHLCQAHREGAAVPVQEGLFP